MKTVTKDESLKLMLSIPKSYMSYKVICHSYLKVKLKIVRSWCAQSVQKEKLCYVYKIPEAGNGL